MESIIARILAIKPVELHPAIVVPSATREFPTAVAAPVPEPAKPSPVVQNPNLQPVSRTNPPIEGQHKALPLVF